MEANKSEYVSEAEGTQSANSNINTVNTNSQGNSQFIRFLDDIVFYSNAHSATVGQEEDVMKNKQDKSPINQLSYLVHVWPHQYVRSAGRLLRYFPSGWSVCGSTWALCLKLFCLFLTPRRQESYLNKNMYTEQLRLSETKDRWENVGDKV